MTRYILHKTLTRRQITAALRPPTWGWAHVDAVGVEFCDLAPGRVWTAGYGSAVAAARIYLHTDGVCVGGAWDTPGDIAFAREIYQKLVESLHEEA